MDNSKSDSPKPAYSYTPDPKTRRATPTRSYTLSLSLNLSLSLSLSPILTLILSLALTRYNNPIFASEQRYIDSVRSSRRDSSPASDQTSQSASESRLTATNRG
eukprot:scaffold71355_cov54-Phaeocystis_antarctica.AAC.1